MNVERQLPFDSLPGYSMYVHKALLEVLKAAGWVMSYQTYSGSKNVTLPANEAREDCLKADTLIVRISE